jgi:hypothetical protein
MYKDGKYLIRRTWIESRLQCGQTIIFQHVQKSCFTGIVQAKKEDFGVFIRET